MSARRLETVKTRRQEGDREAGRVGEREPGREAIHDVTRYRRRRRSCRKGPIVPRVTISSAPFAKKLPVSVGQASVRFTRTHFGQVCIFTFVENYRK